MDMVCLCSSISSKSMAWKETFWVKVYMGKLFLAYASFKPISTNRPKGAIQFHDASINAPESEFTTTSTPSFFKRLMPVTKNGSLDEKMLANTSAPIHCATCSIAWPVPPAAEWIRIVSPGRRRASSTSA
ncbi:unnamed protein product [Periconia digitata]|uniref:Uncharacterized protein n=1 Tax=Periconia digitata TaxID=1303443 RepID=A0A9W4URQ9_9PLEO|nr:unnamed protein product [Periconia digitata]